MLEFHGIDYWYSARNLTGGDHFPARIDSAVESADAMLLVVSENALRSEWVVHEIKTFKDVRPAGRIVPLIISEIDPRHLAALGIADLHYIRFSDCFLTGFEALFQLFDQDFLKPRLTVRNKDRRISSVRQRLRYGFWKNYHEATGSGKFEEFDRRFSQVQKLIEALKPSAASYTFVSREGKRPCDSPDAVEATVREVCSSLGSGMKAITVVESIAESLWERFEVIPRDRRKLGSAARAGN